MNTFGSATYQFPLYDPRGARADRTRFRRDRIPALDRANSLSVPTGEYAARGWLLLARADYDKLDTYNTALQLEIGDPRLPNNVGTVKNLSIVQAQCVTTGLVSDPYALYLVEVTDGRGVLQNEWFQFPLTAQYNIRAPAYPQAFHPASMNSGAPWTWATMLQDIWTAMSAFLGSWPGLPGSKAAPAGVPEGFWFVGVPALPALCNILEHLGMTVACDLTSGSPYTIVDDGASDSAFTAMQAKYLTNLEDDAEYIDTGSGRVPKTIKVLFRRRNSVYGTEETVTYRSDGPYQWDMSSVYTVSVAAPDAFASAAGTHHIWSDFTVRYDMDNQPLAADVSTAAAIAAERVFQYFDRVYSRTSGYMAQSYAGALPFTTGSQVDEVRWEMDHRDRARRGWRTHIRRGLIPQGMGGERGCAE